MVVFGNHMCAQKHYILIIKTHLICSVLVPSTALLHIFCHTNAME